MSYKVTAPLVLAVDQGGHTHHVYQGGLIEWLSDEQEKHFLAEGLAKKVGNAPSEPEGAGDPGADPGGPPAKVAPKPDWVKYAISKGADPVEAEATNKADLIELYGG